MYSPRHTKVLRSEKLSRAVLPHRRMGKSGHYQQPVGNDNGLEFAIQRRTKAHIARRRMSQPARLNNAPKRIINHFHKNDHQNIPYETRRHEFYRHKTLNQWAKNRRTIQIPMQHQSMWSGAPFEDLLRDVDDGRDLGDKGMEPLERLKLIFKDCEIQEGAMDLLRDARKGY